MLLRPATAEEVHTLIRYPSIDLRDCIWACAYLTEAHEKGCIQSSWRAQTLHKMQACTLHEGAMHGGKLFSGRLFNRASTAVQFGKTDVCLL